MNGDENRRNDSISGARKSLIATTAIACVLSVSSSSDINWAANISGIWAWFFLLIAQAYNWAQWHANGGTQQWHSQPKNILIVVKKYFTEQKEKWLSGPMVLFYSVGTLVGWLGFAVIMINLGWAVWLEFLAPPQVPDPHQATYPHRW